MGIVNIQLDIFRENQRPVRWQACCNRSDENAFDGLIRKLDTSDLKDRRMENSKTKTEKEKGLGIASGNRPWESCRTSPKLILENGNPRKKNVAVPGKSQINVKYMIMNPGSSRTPRGVTSLP